MRGQTEHTGEHMRAWGVERVPVTVFPSAGQASVAVAAEIAELIRSRQRSGQRAVLGLATGSTPQSVYAELVRLHREEGLSFANVTTFNLDEYWPMNPDELQSYRRFMCEHLFDHIDIDPEHAHVPDGTIAREDVQRYCADYEQKIREAGGIDLQLLGIGRTGHIGFNEPGSPRDSRTRLITLDKVTRGDAASDFFGEANVPRKAITMGVGSILEARRLVLMAFGEHKATVVRDAVEGPMTAAVSASYLQAHPGARFVLDPSAAASLTRFRSPWLVGSVREFGLEWDAGLTKRAVLWLAFQLKKPILKLTDEDYNEHGLQELLSERGGAYDINIQVFKSLQKTITGWPGGKKDRPRFVVGTGVDAANGPDIYPKRVLVFSPHPDDDVISMGGTFIRLCDQKHEVHVAYQTSGNIAVFDDEVIRHLDFVQELCESMSFGSERAAALASEVAECIRNKRPGDVDSPDLQRVKGLIRRSEARAAARYSGVRPERIHFLDLPFYETGRVKKKPLGEEDVCITMEILERIRPHMIYVAGDLSDPHGTHRVCLAAVTTALHRLADRAWMKDCEVWMYRGAWQEWEPHEIDMAVPLSPSEVERKRTAIFKHESQKDKAPFPGATDSREFWQRAEERNRHTAQLFDQLGLPEYQAIEGFVLWRPSESDGSLAPAQRGREEARV
ncbi:MAG: glucosamine-6-phosphate deaminase [Phycisphaerales bacterium]|nr:glucosamine-6-phosphate deaminase [Phycisphaerales bacterium]